MIMEIININNLEESIEELVRLRPLKESRELIKLNAMIKIKELRLCELYSNYFTDDEEVKLIRIKKILSKLEVIRDGNICKKCREVIKGKSIYEQITGKPYPGSICKKCKSSSKLL